MSWATASGVYLIGGGGSYVSTSEKWKVDGSVEDGFGLQYNVGTWECAIPDEDNKELIITAGTTVSVYNDDGWQRDLAPLNQNRLDHACGSYVNGGKKVKSYYVCSKVIFSC